MQGAGRRIAHTLGAIRLPAPHDLAMHTLALPDHEPANQRVVQCCVGGTAQGTVRLSWAIS